MAKTRTLPAPRESSNWIVSENAAEYQLRPSRLSARSPLQLVHLVRKGVSFHAFEHIRTATGFSMSQWARILGISERTLQRLSIQRSPLDASASERLVQVALLLESGGMTFGRLDLFLRWLSEPSPALGGIQPMDLLDSSIGIGLLESELQRIAYGITG